MFNHHVFINFLLWVKDLSIFDLNNGFYAKNIQTDDLQATGIDDLAQLMRTLMFQIVSEQNDM